MSENDLPHILSINEINDRLLSLNYWKLKENKYLSRFFIAKNFQEGLNFLNKVGEIAEREGHHPDLHLTSYRQIEVRKKENDLFL